MNFLIVDFFILNEALVYQFYNLCWIFLARIAKTSTMTFVASIIASHDNLVKYCEID